METKYAYGDRLFYVGVRKESQEVKIIAFEVVCITIDDQGVVYHRKPQNPQDETEFEEQYVTDSADAVKNILDEVLNN